MLTRPRVIVVAALVLTLASPGVEARPSPVSGRAQAAKRKGNGKKKLRGVGPHVFVKKGAPAIKLSDAVKMRPPVEEPNSGSEDPGWTAPIVEPFEGTLELTASDTFVDPVGLTFKRGRLQTIARRGWAVGIAFDGPGSIGLAMPATAIGGKALLVTCEGELPPQIAVYGKRDEPNGVLWYQAMDLINVADKATFVIDPGDLPESNVFELGLFVPDSSDTGAWSVEKCTIKRV